MNVIDLHKTVEEAEDAEMSRAGNFKAKLVSSRSSEYVYLLVHDALFRTDEIVAIMITDVDDSTEDSKFEVVCHLAGGKRIEEYVLFASKFWDASNLVYIKLVTALMSTPDTVY